MSDRLQTAADRLNARLKAHASQAITYTRGAHSVQLSATISEQQYSEIDAQGFSVAIQATDFLCDADDLILNGSTVLPTTGDTITAADGRTFVVTPAGGEQEYRLVRGRLRIHTKQR